MSEIYKDTDKQWNEMNKMVQDIKEEIEITKENPKLMNTGNENVRKSNKQTKTQR